MTVKEQQEWKIPPCISNWKNAKVLSEIYQAENLQHFCMISLHEFFELVYLLMRSISSRVTPFLWTNVWQPTVGACRRSTSMRTLPSLPKLSTSPTERCASTVQFFFSFFFSFCPSFECSLALCLFATGQRGRGDESPGGEEDGPEGEGEEGGEAEGAGPDGSRPQGRD